jgi:hypothetical protein
MFVRVDLAAILAGQSSPVLQKVESADHSLGHMSTSLASLCAFFFLLVTLLLYRTIRRNNCASKGHDSVEQSLMLPDTI